jgi:hypothetical protein
MQRQGRISIGIGLENHDYKNNYARPASSIAVECPLNPATFTKVARGAWFKAWKVEG